MSLLNDVLQIKQIFDRLSSMPLNGISDDEALAGLKLLGFEKVDQVTQFLNAAREHASDPGETVMQFLTNGDLAKIFTARQAKSESVVVQCIHCGELNFIS